MLIFALAAMAGYFLSILLPPLDRLFPNLDNRTRFSRFVQCLIGGATGIVATTMVFVHVIDPVGILWQTVARLRRPEVAHLFFGLVFGLFLRFWASYLWVAPTGQSTPSSPRPSAPEPATAPITSEPITKEAVPPPSARSGSGSLTRLFHWAKNLLRPPTVPPRTSPPAEGFVEARYWASVVLAGLLVMGIAGPYSGQALSDLLTRMTGLKTPFGELSLQVAAASRDRAFFETERERYIESRLPLIKTFLLAIERDIALSQVLKPDTEIGALATARSTFYRHNFRFTELMLPLMLCAEVVRKRTGDDDSVRGLLRPWTHRFRTLVVAAELATASQNARPFQGAAPKDLVDEQARFASAVNSAYRGSAELLAPERNCDSTEELKTHTKDVEKRNQEQGRQAAWNEGFLQGTGSWPASVDARHLADGPYAHILLGSLMAYLRNFEAGIDVVSPFAALSLEGAAKRNKLTEDVAAGGLVNAGGLHAFLLRYAGRDADLIVPRLDKHTLTILAELERRVTARKGLRGIRSGSDETFGPIDMRLKAFRILTTNVMAAFAAQSADARFFRLWQREAMRYAESNYYEFAGVAGLLGPDYRAEIADTYGTIIMLSEARKDKPDTDQIRRARDLFEEAAQIASEAGRHDALARFRQHFSRSEALLQAGR